MKKARRFVAATEAFPVRAKTAGRVCVNEERVIGANVRTRGAFERGMHDVQVPVLLREHSWFSSSLCGTSRKG